jgi:hypothetical protein
MQYMTCATGHGHARQGQIYLQFVTGRAETYIALRCLKKQKAQPDEGWAKYLIVLVPAAGFELAT